MIIGNELIYLVFQVHANFLKETVNLFGTLLKFNLKIETVKT